MQSYTQYHCKSFHEHLVGTKCQHFGYLVHHHSPYTSRDIYVSRLMTSPGIEVQDIVFTNGASIVPHLSPHLHLSEAVTINFGDQKSEI